MPRRIRLHRLHLAAIAVSGLLAVAAGQPAQADQPRMAYSVPEKRIVAPQARQGVASDGDAIYAVDNSAIAKYAIADGRLLESFTGKAEDFPHLNSCTLAQDQLVCASSNYPATPHRGTIEFFDRTTLAHLRSVALKENPGSLTALNRHDGHWWASFANYDGKGGVPGQDHRSTLFAEMSDDFRILRTFSFPPSILERLAPYSISGAAWGPNGRLYVSGHDKPEIYVLQLPPNGSELKHVGIIAVSFFGQAVDFDPRDAGRLWGIDRKTRTVIASRIPAIVSDETSTQRKQR